MNEAIEKCKFCGRNLSDLEIYERCPCKLDDLDKEIDYYDNVLEHDDE